MPKYSIPCVYFVNIFEDGVGDLSHQLGSLDLLANAEDEIENAFFVFYIQNHFKDRDLTFFKQSILDLDESHPLRRFPGEIIQSTNLEDIRVALKAKIKDKAHFYNISSFPDDVYEMQSSVCDELLSLRAFLEEHGSLLHTIGSTVGFASQQLLQLQNTMSLHVAGAGIFISKLPVENDKGIFTRLGIPDDAALLVAYSHGNIEVTTRNIATLMRNFPDKKLHLLFTKKLSESDLEKVKTLLGDNVILVNNTIGWINSADLKQLKARQANTAFFGIAGGDNTLQDCISYGLFPIIGADMPFGKMGFYKEFAAMLASNAAKFSTEKDAVNLAKILKYFNAYATPKLELINGAYSLVRRHNEELANIDAACMSLWRDSICPYLRQEYDISWKIHRNVKIFRCLGELINSPQDSTAQEIKDYLRSDPEVLTGLLEYYRQSLTDKVNDKLPVKINKALILKALLQVAPEFSITHAERDKMESICSNIDSSKSTAAATTRSSNVSRNRPGLS